MLSCYSVSLPDNKGKLTFFMYGREKYFMYRSMIRPLAMLETQCKMGNLSYEVINMKIDAYRVLTKAMNDNELVKMLSDEDYKVDITMLNLKRHVLLELAKRNGIYTYRVKNITLPELYMIMANALRSKGHERSVHLNRDQVKRFPALCVAYHTYISFFVKTNFEKTHEVFKKSRIYGGFSASFGAFANPTEEDKYEVVARIMSYKDYLNFSAENAKPPSDPNLLSMTIKELNDIAQFTFDMSFLDGLTDKMTPEQEAVVLFTTMLRTKTLLHPNLYKYGSEEMLLSLLGYHSEFDTRVLKLIHDHMPLETLKTLLVQVPSFQLDYNYNKGDFSNDSVK